MGKYTNPEDRREVISLVVRTLLGIACTIGLLCWYSGVDISFDGFGISYFEFLKALLFSEFGIIIAVVCTVVFAAAKKFYQSVNAGKLLLVNFVSGALSFVYILAFALLTMLLANISYIFVSILFYGVIFLHIAAFALTNLVFIKVNGQYDYEERSLPNAFGLFLLSVFCYGVPCTLTYCIMLFSIRYY
ncbi:MAG: hypothetical protein J6A37_05665 [Oscillospiraceae bacterium]|nr:hypothetical protein [Oscillospiraceae bacterium]